MVDQVSPERRSANMARIRGKDTAPEIRVRRVAHALGFRFRLHRKDLPGKPDLVFPRHRVALFVHGCFWHQHLDCHRANIPKSRGEYWIPKLGRNVERDRRNTALLRDLGWQVITIWECETKDLVSLRDKLLSFLGERRSGH